MNCERCNTVASEQAAFRVRSEIIDLKVCFACAMEAKALNLAVEPLAPQTKTKPAVAA